MYILCRLKSLNVRAKAATKNGFLSLFLKKEVQEKVKRTIKNNFKDFLRKNEDQFFTILKLVAFLSLPWRSDFYIYPGLFRNQEHLDTSFKCNNDWY